MKRFIVGEASSLQNFTDNTCAQASFCLRTLLKEKNVRVNGVRVSGDLPLAAGDEVCYYMTPSQEAKRAFTVLYEDEELLVADKESGVNSEAVFAEAGEGREVFPVHRLDRNTEGLLLLAKTEPSREALLAAFRARAVEKVYLALVVGAPPRVRDRAVGYLVKDEKRAVVRVFGSEREAARAFPEKVAEKICTEYEVLEERGEETLLKVVLHTGKTHQIRAHLRYLGCPVVGDGKYGDGAYNARVHATRQRLLAKEIVLHAGGALAYLDGKVFCSQKNL